MVRDGNIFFQEFKGIELASASIRLNDGDMHYF